MYCDDLSLNVEKFDGNMLLEGDNYIWLQMLAQTHKGKINVIYIDPPYNTGKNDFSYNDSFVNENDKFKHSKWLDFISKRLTIARTLLSNDGIICISIDNNEQAHLQLLCDDIFGYENRVATIPRKTATKIRKVSAAELQVINDFVLIYKKTPDTLLRQKKVSSYTYDYSDELGQYRLAAFQNSGEDGTRRARPNLYYPIYQHVDGTLSLDYENSATKFLPKKVKGEDGRWLWSKEKFIADKDTLTVHDGTIRKKIYQHNDLANGKDGSYASEKCWLDGFLNQQGTSALKSILGEGAFDYPKPPALIRWLVYLHPNNNATVLDFFAGSGTTAQAVEELNAEDGGNRHWIICTNNENDICRSVTKPRIDTVITGVRTDGSKYSDGIDSSYAYFQYEMLPRTSNSARNSRSLLVPRIVDTWLMMLYGVRRVRTDEARKAFIYEGDDVAAAALFGDPTADDVEFVLSDADASRRAAYVPDGSSALLSDSPDGIDVMSMSSLVTSAYLS